jgi:transcriptional regulator with XRE-family HTH domain
MENACTLFRVNDEKTRDPYNTAIAAVLKDSFDSQDYGEARLVRATGISRASLRRYLDGDRDIKIADLRKIAAALHMTMPKVVSEADRRLKQTD